MSEITVGKSWEHNGYHCEVRIMPLGHYSEREPDAIICHGVRYEKVNA